MFSEDMLEQLALDKLGDNDWQALHGTAVAPGSGERQNWKEIVLRQTLNEAVSKLNPEVPEEFLQQAIGELLTPKSQDPVAENLRVHQMLVQGYSGIEYYDLDGQRQNPTIYFVSSNVDKNDYKVVNQIIIRNVEYERRFDVVAYINGLPVAFFELKKPSGKSTAEEAFNQLQTYVHEFPMAFRFANVVVASDGIDARYGTPFTPLNHMSPWNVDDDGKPIKMDQPDSSGEIPLGLENVIWGVFNQVRFLQLMREYTAFDDTERGLYMRIAKPHQYFAVTKAAGTTMQAMRSDGRAGVVWHTQGSGKSMEMEMYTAKVMRAPELESPTIIVINDRTELDGQLYSTFLASTLLPEKPRQIEDRDDLRTALATRTSGGIYFTTLQKFGLTADERNAYAKHPVLSQRHNIIVIADEAHRSHYGFGANRDGYAAHLRSALPNATMIAFTGTPISELDRNTRKVFGNDIDVYDLQRAVDDGATVPVYFEPRLIPLARVQGITDEYIDATADEALEGLSESERARIQRTTAALEAMYGADDRLDTLVDDLLLRWEDRKTVMQDFIGCPGKAMIVTSTRSIAMKIYDKIIAKHPDWHSDADDKGKIKVVYSANPSDTAEIKKHMRRPSAIKAVKERVKNPDDELEIIIVKDMMLTGFDAPPLHTLFIDRPLRGALLMQTLARVNRTFRGKQDGLLIAYAPLTDNLKEALDEFTVDAEKSGEKVIGQHAAETLTIAQQFLGQIHELVTVDWHTKLQSGDVRGALATVVGFLRSPQTPGNTDPEDPMARPVAKKFRELSSALARSWAIAVTADGADEIRSEVEFYLEARQWLIKIEAADRASRGEPISDTARRILGQLVVDAAESREVLDIYAEIGQDVPNLQELASQGFSEKNVKSNIEIAIEALRAKLQQGVRDATGNNELRSQLFSERIREVMTRYTNQQLTAAEVIAELVKLSKEVVEESRRGEKFAPALSNDELTFFDVVSQNESAVDVLGDDVLAEIARDLVATMRRDTRTDWTVRDDVKAKLRRTIKLLLRKYGYPPDRQKEATQLVYEQMEKFAPRYAGELGSEGVKP
ncbi:putative type I restriction/modification system protein [Corynebacterium diphtheriae HC01]|uniref:type I restriction endonuclease subunit R n=1 Tax=Corynebacterium diphtheriae TaxID=1717 RepID=UPI000245B522|nr:type I restriction endonuclease subunit R [Corynebacterium diphtheriae]AEX45251.1 putative type I restriction/modification system protein [Corynebacterium diphtheriae 241]AEX75440.1 putative type I restriction/modification system protein [Corynebacterium diphtheriae HC01]